MVDQTRQANLLSPSTSGTTGALLQDKPENTIEPDVSQIQVENPEVPQATEMPPAEELGTATENPGLPPVTKESPVSKDYSINQGATSNRHQELRQRRKELNEEMTKGRYTIAERLKANRQAVEKGTPTVKKEGDSIDWANLPEEMFWSSVRSLNHGFGFMADMVPTAIAQGVDAIDNYFLDDSIDTSKYQYMVTRTMDDRWGTTDSYATNAITEVVGDVSEALPMTINIAGAMSRYGLNQLAKTGVLNRYSAPYSLDFMKSIGIDTAAITAGEAAEEITEEYAGEDSAWGLAANVGTSIFSGYRMQKALQPDNVMTDLAQRRGGQIAGEAPKDTKGIVAKTRDVLIDWATTNKITRTLFEDFASQAAHFADYNRELSLIGKSGKSYIRELWSNVLNDQQRSQFMANLETASHLGLRLTPYELMDHESLRPMALAVAKITPEDTLKRLDDNLKALDRLVGKEAPELTEVARDDLKSILNAHNTNLDKTVDNLRSSMQKRKQDLLDDIAKKEGAEDKAAIGEAFKSSVNEYITETKKIFGNLFDKAVDGKATVSPSSFSKNLKGSLENLQSGTFTLPKKAGKLVADMIQSATPTKNDKGLTTYGKIAVRDLMDARTSLNKGLAGLNVNDPMFNQNRQSLFNAIEAIDDTLASTLPPDSFASFSSAKEAWKQNVGIKFGARETDKLTTRDTFNNPFYNGQEMLEVLFSGASKETKAKAYADFLAVRAEDLAKYTDDPTEKVINSAMDAKLHIKQYMVNQMISEIAMNPKKPMEDIIQGYMQRNSKVLTELLDEVDFDPGKIVRDVEVGIEDMKKAEEALLASKLNLGSGDSDVFDLSTYLNKTVLENKPEMDRLVKLMDNPEELAKLNYTKDGIQELFSSVIIRDLVGEAPNGRVLDTNLRKLLDKAPKKLEKLLGEKRVDHMRKFLVGHKMATKLKPSDAKGSAINLTENLADSVGLSNLPSLVSDRMMIAKRIASPHYVYTLRAIRIIGGLNTNGQKKFMARAMTDTDFFMDILRIKGDTADDISKLRFALAANGIDTSVKNKKEAEEQVQSLEEANAEIEGSPFLNEETHKAIIEDTMGVTDEDFNESTPETYTEDDIQFMRANGELTEDDVSFMRNEGVIEGSEKPEPVVEEKPKEKPKVNESNISMQASKLLPFAQQGIPKEQLMDTLESLGLADNASKDQMIKYIEEAYAYE